MTHDALAAKLGELDADGLANLKHRAALLRREATYSGVWFVDTLWATADYLDLIPQLLAELTAANARVKEAEGVIKKLAAIIDMGVSVNISDEELRSAHPEDRRFIKRTRKALAETAQWLADREGRSDG